MWLLVNQTGELQNRLLTVILFTVTVIKNKMEREGRGEGGGGKIRGGNESGRLILIRS